MKKILSLMIFVLVILPLVSADIIVPGYSPIEINNKITNFDDYPDYYFIVAGKLGNSYNDSMCNPWEDDNWEINFVKEDGIIETPYYKFCQISVFALKKSEFSEEDLKDTVKILDYLDSKEAIKVIQDLNHYEEKHVSDPVKMRNYEYKIEIGKTLVKPTNSSNVRDYKIYLYIGIPIICLLIIIYIFIKRRRA